MAAAAATATGSYYNTRSKTKKIKLNEKKLELFFSLDADASTIDSLLEMHSTVFIRAGVAAGACLS